MNNSELSLSLRINELFSDVENYILSNPDWIYYFAKPYACDEIYMLLREYPHDWQDKVGLNIINFNQTSVKVSINIADGTETGNIVNRVIFLASFEDGVKTNKDIFKKDYDKLMIKYLKDDISRLKDALHKKEIELSQLSAN